MVYKRLFENTFEFSDKVKKVARSKGWEEWLNIELPIENINNALSKKPEKLKGVHKVFYFFLLAVKKEREGLSSYSLKKLFSKYKIKPFILKKRRDFLIFKFLTKVLRDNNIFTNGKFIVLNKKLASFLWNMADDLGFEMKKPEKYDEIMLDTIYNKIIPNKWKKMPLQPIAIDVSKKPLELLLKSNEDEDYIIKVNPEIIQLFLKFFPGLTIHETGILKSDPLIILNKNKIVGFVMPYWR